MGKAIVLSNLSKEYRLSTPATKVMSLNNISLSVDQGEVVGIIGKNGSGKSTLLKILGGLTKPTSGMATLSGNVSSILDIGSNFYTELSGEENTKNSLRIAGVHGAKGEVLLREIHKFSGIGKNFFNPVKTYSNGMYLRLAFAVAFNTLADILLIDEILSVGDEAFKMKSFDYIKQLKNSDKTILLATHNRQEILELCTRCIWLEDGKVVMDGLPMDIMLKYYEDQQKIFKKEKNTPYSHLPVNKNGIIQLDWDAATAPGNSDISIRQFWVYSEHTDLLYTNQPVCIKICIAKKRADVLLRPGIIFYDQFRQPLFFISTLNSTGEDNLDTVMEQQDIFEISCSIPPFLLNAGVYHIELRIGRKSIVYDTTTEDIFRFDFDFRIQVHHPPQKVAFAPGEFNFPLLPFLDWKIKPV